MNDSLHMDGCMPACVHAWTDGWISWMKNNLLNEQMNECTHACMDGWVSELENGCTNEWMKIALMNEGMNEWIYWNEWMENTIKFR